MPDRADRSRPESRQVRRRHRRRWHRRHGDGGAPASAGTARPSSSRRTASRAAAPDSSGATASPSTSAPPRWSISSRAASAASCSTSIGMPPLDGEALPGYVAWLPDRVVTLHRDPAAWAEERLRDARRHAGAPRVLATARSTGRGLLAGQPATGSSCPSADRRRPGTRRALRRRRATCHWPAT